jgi:hypothetical protein
MTERRDAGSWIFLAAGLTIRLHCCVLGDFVAMVNFSRLFLPILCPCLFVSLSIDVISTGRFALSQNQVTVQSGYSPPPVIGHVTISARGFEPTKADLGGPGPHNTSITGHIFIEVTQNTDGGPVSETYGFYPSPTNGNLGMIRGPGSLRSESRCDDCTKSSIEKHFGAIRESVDVDITLVQKQSLFTKIDEWNRKDYQLLDSNCIDFVDSVVRTLGYPTPPRYPA